MGNDTSININNENNGALFVPSALKKSFHSVHDANGLFQSDNTENIDTNEKEPETPDIIEIPLTGVSTQKPVKITKRQQAKEKWKKNLEEAINVTPNANIIENIGDAFHYRKRLAKGSSCCVLLCQHKTNKKLYALKEMNKFSQWNPSLYVTERKILNTLKSHVNIMTYFDSYIDKKCLYIASEYCGGGTLLDKIIHMKTFTEKIAAKYIATILNVVHFIHQHNIAHRDLKPNNIVFDKHGDEGILKLIDFGDAIIIKDNESDATFVGTLHYFTPEMIRNPNRKGWQIRKADTYCIGVIAYVLLTGCFPFHSKDKHEIKKKILSGDLVWPNHVKLSDECKQFILSLLNQNVKQRLNAKQALSHKWLMGYASNDDLGDNLKKHQTHFHHSNVLQRLLIDAMFAEMTKDEKQFCVEQLKKYKKKGKKNMSNSRNEIMSPKSKSRRNSLIYEQEFVEFMIANHVDENKAKIETHKLFKQVSRRNNMVKNTHAVGTPTLDAFDVESLLEELIKENAFEMSPSTANTANVDEFGFEETPEPLFDEKEDILVSLHSQSKHYKKHKKTKSDILRQSKNVKFTNNNHNNLMKMKSMNSIAYDNYDNKELMTRKIKRSQSVNVVYKPSIKITNCDLKLSIEISRTLTNKKSKSDICDENMDSDTLDVDDLDQAIEFGRSESVYKTSVDLSKRLSITVQQFRNLLSKAPKKLDIESVIDDLDPKHTGIIDLRNITNYSREIEMED